MNKAYKVIWSKVKHCYVVVSELAKRNGKGAGKMLAAGALGVCLVMAPAMAWAANFGGYISGSDYIGSDDIGGNGVFFDDQTGDCAGVKNVYGGKSDSDSAVSNSVQIEGSVSLSTVYGGFSTLDFRGAIGNLVEIGGSASVDTVYGGYASGSGGSTYANIVRISSGFSGDLSGASIWGGNVNGDSNILNVEANATVNSIGNFEQCVIASGKVLTVNLSPSDTTLSGGGTLSVKSESEFCISSENNFTITEGSELDVKNASVKVTKALDNTYNGTLRGGKGVTLKQSVKSPDLNIIASSGDITAESGIAGAKSLTATSGNITATGKGITAGTITASGSVTAEGITATGNVKSGSVKATSLTATDHTLTLTGTGSEIGTTNLGEGTLTINANAGGSVGALTAGTVSINTGGDLTATIVNNLKNLSVTGGTLSLGGASNLSAVDVTLAEGGMIRTNAGALTIGDVSGAGTVQGKEGVSLKYGINNTELDIVAESKDIDATAGGVSNAKSLMAPNGNIVATGQNITAGTVSAKGNVTAENITAGTISVSGKVTAATVAATGIYFNSITPDDSAPVLRAAQILNGTGSTTLHLENMSFASTPEPDAPYALIALDNASIGAANGLTTLSYKDGSKTKEASLPNSAGITITSDPISKKLTNTTIEARDSYTVKTAEDNKALYYTYHLPAIETITVNRVTERSDLVPEGWTLAQDEKGNVTATVETDGMSVPDVEPGKKIMILQSGADNFFAGVAINGENKYGPKEFSETQNNVTVAGSQSRGVTTDDAKKNIIYAADTKEVASVSPGAVNWQKDAVLFDGSSAGYNYAKVSALGTDKFAITYDKPETVSAGDSMTLLKANETLKDIAAQTKNTRSYTYSPVSGVTLDAAVTGSLEAKGGKVTFTAAENRADKLTFGNVAWKDSGALIDHKTTLANVSFNGADVDTSKINFTNIKSLEAHQKMTLVSGFGDSVGTITGTKYTVGTALEGEGAASLSGSDLIFTAKTGTDSPDPKPVVQEQTHKTVMAMAAGMAVLAAGNEHIGKAVDGLADMANRGEDGASTFASVGGGASRSETGSHVTANTWNALAAIGGKKDLGKSSVEYGIFGEYGKGSYTLHSAAGRGDGDAHYAGGGLLAKWVSGSNVYAEASFHMGRMSDSTTDLLYDGAGNGYGYNKHANYYGGHVGIGRVFRYENGRNLDVYGKYFHMKRDGMNFTAGEDVYSLDSVTSSVLRVGARYGATDKKWNWYGGLAYEYEFDGRAEGTVNGNAIRAAGVKGSSVRGEIGLRMFAGQVSPWQADISLYGYAGKRRGAGGSVSVAYTF